MDLQEQIDQAGAVVRHGFPWWLRLLLARDVAGITLGRRIYVQACTGDLRRVLQHELVHIRQIRRLGAMRFYAQYVREYVRNRFLGWPPDVAYRRVSLEAEAFAAEEEESV